MWKNAVIPSSAPALQDSGRRVGAAFLLMLAASPCAAQLPAVHGGNLRVVQNDATNNDNGITLTLDSSVNQFTASTPSNRGDFAVFPGPVREPNPAPRGIFLAAVRENGRDNSALPNVGGNTGGGTTGKVYSTPSIEVSGSSVLLSLSHSQSGNEFNANTAALYFPFHPVAGQGWTGGWARNAADGGPITAADSYFSPGIRAGHEFLDLGGGISQLDLRGVPGIPPAASQNGVLLTVGGRGEDNFSQGQAVPDGTFNIFVRDNGNTAPLEQDPVAFLYIPAGSAQVTAGRVLGDATVVPGTGSGVFSTTKTGTSAGQVLLTVPGVTGPDDAVLIVSAEGGEALNSDNFVNYEWRSSLGGYIVETRDIPASASAIPVREEVGSEPMFSFVLARTVPQISVEQPDGTRRINGTLIEFGNLLPGAGMAKTFRLRNNRAGTLTVSGVTVTGRDAADFTVTAGGSAATVAEGDSITFTVNFSPLGTGNRVARLQVNSSSSEHPVYDLQLTGGGLSATAPDIVWAGDNPTPNSLWQDDTDSLPATDAGFISLLRSAGYNVIRFNIPNGGSIGGLESAQLDAGQLAALNAADLVILGRAMGMSSIDGATGLETAAWNTQITRPLLSTNAFASSASRLGWFSAVTAAAPPDAAPDSALVFPDPAAAVPAFLLGAAAVSGGVTQGPVYEMMTPLNSAIIGTDRGPSFCIAENLPPAAATVIARGPAVSGSGHAIMTLPAGTVLPGGGPSAETPSGGQTLGGFRMLFAAGNREPVAPDNAGNAGYENLTADGERMFLRAVMLALNQGAVPVLPQDADADGLPDAWEVAHFGSVLVANGSGDPDADGLNNFGEYAFGLSPHGGDFSALPVAHMADGLLSITVQKQPHVAYNVVASRDLSPGSFSGAGLVIVTDTPSVLQVREVAASDRRFLRVLAEPAP